MNISKTGLTRGGETNELALVNAFAKTQLTAEEIYTFSVLLCDNEVDRDFERFTEETLEQLAELFVGKTGISDHQWSADRQIARIYRTEIVAEEGRKNALGLPYTYLKGYAYMLRTPGNEELITEIEGGIRRETSVGCAVAKSICSICGQELGSGQCGHCPGHEYDGVICHAELTQATDAYEWSFVAVPAQKNAGVLKRFAQTEKHSSQKAALLEKEAAMGRKYLHSLRTEVLRLALMADRDLHGVLEKKAAQMDEDTLLGLKAMLDRQLQERFPPLTQLPGKNQMTRFDGGAYLV